ncbi:hypothetical protein [Acidiphilium sp.]|uniref:hypothetical protein n=1 Tax=Acidiphilium sp. TaxID=527 RepID=UPI002C76D6A8|nr:hypothetical protein [Acidiphilium sp.]HQT62775.1 hypothetical protein [Acidiphilium sp.]
MSGVGGILSALAGAGQLFGGYGSVTIGPVRLQGIEVPNSIPVGGRQMMAVHKLPGGQRVIDAMGRDDADIVWSGILQGPAAEQRMQLLDGLRQSGQEITLTYGTSVFTVVVAAFAASYERLNWIPYKIACTVVADQAASFGILGPSTSDVVTGALGGAAQALSQAAADVQTVTNAVQSVAGPVIQTVGEFAPIASVFGVDLSAPLATAENYLGDAQSVGLIAGDLTQAPAALASMSTTLSSAATSIGSAFGQAQAGMAGIVNSAAALGGSLVGSVNDFLDGVAASSVLANGAVAAAQVGVAQKQMNDINPQAAPTGNGLFQGMTG